MKQLKPGFTVVSNISEFAAAAHEATGYISKSNSPDHFVFRIKQILFPEENQ